MMQKTRGIVINSFKHGENNLISRIYTEEFGLLSFIVHGARKSRSGRKQVIFQPLNVIEIVFPLKNANNLQNLKEIRLIRTNNNIAFDMTKASIVMFIAEVLKACLKEQEKNQQLFNFLLNRIDLLDKSNQKLSSFHLVFLLELSKFLGFYPRNNFDEYNIKFDLLEGTYQPGSFKSAYCLSAEESLTFNKLQNITIKNINQLEISSSQRKMLLYKLIDFYRLHIVGFKELVSPKILAEVLH